MRTDDFEKLKELKDSQLSNKQIEQAQKQAQKEQTKHKQQER